MMSVRCVGWAGVSSTGPASLHPAPAAAPQRPALAHLPTRPAAPLRLLTTQPSPPSRPRTASNSYSGGASQSVGVTKWDPDTVNSVTLTGESCHPCCVGRLLQHSYVLIRVATAFIGVLHACCDVISQLCSPQAVCLCLCCRPSGRGRDCTERGRGQHDSHVQVCSRTRAVQDRLV